MGCSGWKDILTTAPPHYLLPLYLYNNRLLRLQRAVLNTPPPPPAPPPPHAPRTCLPACRLPPCRAGTHTTHPPHPLPLCPPFQTTTCNKRRALPHACLPLPRYPPHHFTRTTASCHCRALPLPTAHPPPPTTAPPPSARAHPHTFCYPHLPFACVPGRRWAWAGKRTRQVSWAARERWRRKWRIAAASTPLTCTSVGQEGRTAYLLRTLVPAPAPTTRQALPTSRARTTRAACLLAASCQYCCQLAWAHLRTWRAFSRTKHRLVNRVLASLSLCLAPSVLQHRAAPAIRRSKQLSPLLFCRYRSTDA